VIYLPDTNAWIAFLRRKNGALVQRFLQADPADLRLCSVVLGELLYGLHHSPPSYQAHNARLLVELRQQFDSLPFDDRAAEEYGKLRADLAVQGEHSGFVGLGGVFENCLNYLIFKVLPSSRLVIRP
jgi:tRNA(fMet)-specific endonuclease VapC